MKRSLIHLSILICSLCMLFSACITSNTPGVKKLELTQWNNGMVKERILSYVKEVTTEGSERFVPIHDRIAVFDFDGTVGCEKPDYMEVIVAMKQLCKQAQLDNSLYQKDSLYTAACNEDLDYINKNVYAAILTAFLGYDQNGYIDSVKTMTSQDLHPRFKRTYSKMYYAPMQELIDLLESHDFTVYFVSGSEEGFLRGYAEGYLDIPSERIIGSTISLDYQYDEKKNSSQFLRDSLYLKPMADGPGKAELIKNRIGKQPILAFGNTMGDYQMLTYTNSNKYSNLELILVHDDPREYVYHDKTLEAKAKLHQWVEVGMKESFKVIFPMDSL